MTTHPQTQSLASLAYPVFRWKKGNLDCYYWVNFYSMENVEDYVDKKKSTGSLEEKWVSVTRCIDTTSKYRQFFHVRNPT